MRQGTLFFPVVSACAKSITFPVQHLQNAESFKELFTLAYCKSQAFGHELMNGRCLLPSTGKEKRQTMGLNKEYFLCIVYTG